MTAPIAEPSQTLADEIKALGPAAIGPTAAALQAAAPRSWTDQARLLQAGALVVTPAADRIQLQRQGRQPPLLAPVPRRQP